MTERKEEAMEQKRMIALEFLSICATKLRDAETFEQRVIESKMRLYYLKLAERYGCRPAEMQMALGITSSHLGELLVMARELAEA
jgi:CRP-like cAMP-binding protein